MDDPEDSTAHTVAKHARSPGIASAPRSSTKKRARIAGSKNLKNHEWVLAHQHFLRRNKEDKGTVFVIHGVEHHWHNVRRKILRASAALKQPLDDCESLSPLPWYIEFRSPPSGLIAPPPVDFVEAGSNLDSSSQRPEETLSLQSSRDISDTQNNDFISNEEEYDMDKAGNAFLGKLRVSEIFDIYRKADLRQPTSSFLTIDTCYFCGVWVHRSDTFQTFVARFNSLESRADSTSSHLAVLLRLVREERVAIGHLLETLIRNLSGKQNEVLDWLASKLRCSESDGRALGAAAYQNNFEAVDTLLNRGADINGTVSGPHSTPDCCCEIGIIAYAHLQRFNGAEKGVTEEMIAYLLDQGLQKSARVNLSFLGLLTCVLRPGQRRYTWDGSLLFNSRPIVELIHYFADIEREAESILETCILASSFDCLSQGSSVQDRIHVFEYLLDQGAQTSSGSPLAALIYRNGPQKLVEKLLIATEDINAYCNSASLANYSLISIRRCFPPFPIQSVSPLQAAALHGSEKIIHLLLEKGADANCPARNSRGVTPLQAICCLKGTLPQQREEKLRIVTLLLDYGADVNAAPAWDIGLTALQAAVFVGDKDIATFLVSRGADVNAPACRSRGGSALGIATIKRYSDMVRFLLLSGAAIPPGGAMIPCLGIYHDVHNSILGLLRISASELAAMGCVNGNLSRDYHEYEAEWADDPTYDTES